MIQAAWLIPLTPFLSAIILGIWGKRFNLATIGTLAAGSVCVSFLLSLNVLFGLLTLDDRSVELHLYTWMATGNFNAEFGFLVDQLSAVMILNVTGVGFLIHLFSIGYMKGDPGIARFFSYMNFFVASMLVLVLGNNFMMMFLGWEGVGLFSYLLIGYYYKKDSARSAATKAFIMNRIGDFGFLLGMLLIFLAFGTLNYLDVFEKAELYFHVGDMVLTAICLLLFVGAMGKSAQIPLYTWLADAMEGPTPVSALIHAATMVTAGVYMVVRCSTLFDMAPVAMFTVAVVGGVTALYSATIGITQTDIKRVLAYSTVSQLGYMFLACGVGAYVAAIFHLVTHAFFKACLFLGSGSVIHAMHEEQDIQKMGALKKYLPITHATFFIATLAIMGIFPFAGFFSKDEILWNALIQGNVYLWALGAGAAFVTAFYMSRLYFLTFCGESRVEPSLEKKLHESPKIMTVPLVVLATLAFFGGLLGVPFIEGGHILKDWLTPVIHHRESIMLETAHHEQGLEVLMMGLTLAIALAGAFLAYKMYIKDTTKPLQWADRFPNAYRILFNKYYIDEIYDAIFTNPTINLSKYFWKEVDAKIVDGVVNGAGKSVRFGSRVLRLFQTGYTQNYALSIFVSGFVLVLFFIAQ